MLNEEQVSLYIEALIRMGVLHRVPGDGDKEELIRFSVQQDGLVGRILGGEFGELPEGDDLVEWFSCILLKTLLQERNITASKDAFIGMAAVMTGFLSEQGMPGRLRSRDDRLVISHRRPRK